jgi:hypothetical protein
MQQIFEKRGNQQWEAAALADRLRGLVSIAVGLNRRRGSLHALKAFSTILAKHPRGIILKSACRAFAHKIYSFLDLAGFSGLAAGLAESADGLAAESVFPASESFFADCLYPSLR